MDGYADISANAFGISQIRGTVVDYSIPFISSPSLFLVSNLPTFSWQIFLQPLHYSTWLLIVFIGVIVAVSLRFIVDVGNEPRKDEFKFF